jgi:beta-glucosidase
LPPFDDYSMAGRTYRFFNGDPLYRFGYGLSYSHFRYTQLPSRRRRTSALPQTISVAVTNVSKRDGDEVVQLYVSSGGALPALAAFQRVHIPAGQTVVVRLQPDPEAVPPGPLTMWIGGGPPPRPAY